LNSCTSDDEQAVFEQQIVDFRTTQTVDKAYLLKAVSNQNDHIRLISPYVEHLSQVLGRYFMRIGLPIDLVVED
jgi:hypothetical protein